MDLVVDHEARGMAQRDRRADLDRSVRHHVAGAPVRQRHRAAGRAPSGPQEAEPDEVGARDDPDEPPPGIEDRHAGDIAHVHRARDLVDWSVDVRDLEIASHVGDDRLIEVNTHGFPRCEEHAHGTAVVLSSTGRAAPAGPQDLRRIVRARAWNAGSTRRERLCPPLSRHEATATPRAMLWGGTLIGASNRRRR
ncbi:MAG TPA: hypothetical protein VK607_21810 [Kofleriaceae bacterium]|nr:hypothetical protein [Kofleriaceae bacterium]